MPLTEEMKKSIEEIVNETLNQVSDKTEEKVEKSEEETNEEDIEKGKGKPDEKTPANGGDDKMKSGSPYNEKQNMKKSDDEEKTTDEEKVEKSEEETTTEEETKTMVRKSIEDLKDHLTEDELEVISAWREEIKADEPMTKSMSTINEDTITKVVTAAVTAQTEELKKAINAKDEEIKNLNETINKIASQPAHSKRSVDSLETIEKSGDQPETLNKSQVLDTMLDLQLAGKGINSKHIAEFEATGNISNARVRSMVQNACKNK